MRPFCDECLKSVQKWQEINAHSFPMEIEKPLFLLSFYIYKRSAFSTNISNILRF